MNSTRTGLMLIFGVIAVVVVLKLLSVALQVLIPLAVVLGIGLVLYGVVSRKSLGGGGRRLP